MLRLHINRGFKLSDAPADTEPRRTSLRGTEAAFVVAGAFACAVAGFITLMVCLFERFQRPGGPVVFNVTLGAIFGLLALGVLDHLWHGKHLTARKVYPMALVLMGAGLIFGLAGFVVTSPILL